MSEEGLQGELGISEEALQGELGMSEEALQGELGMSEEALQGELRQAAQGQGRPRWLGRAAVWAGLLGLLAILFLGLLRSQQGPVGIGQRAPEFTLTTFDGNEIDTGELRGRVILVNFWASWCKPCEQEARELEQAYQLYADQGVVFLGVDYVDTEPEARAYLQRFGISYPNGPDLGTEVSQAFRTRGVPETYVIGPDGRITSVKIGPFLSLDEIVAAIEAARVEG